MFVAIVMFIFVVITAVVTALISGWASDSKQKKIARSMAQDYSESTKKKEEVIKSAHEKTSSVNAADIKTSFDSSIDILQDLSRKRK